MVRIATVVLAIAATLALTAWLARDLPPPGTVRFAAGAEGGGYWRIAERYRAILARDGIDLVLLTTEGSVENATLLSDGAADAGLLQGGIVPADPTVETLGAVFAEPVLIFARAEGGRPVAANLATWDGLRIAVGGEGSGTRAAANALLAVAGGAGDNVLSPAGGAAAAEALMAAEVDVAVFVAPLSAPYLEPLLRDPATTLIEPDHALALSRRIAEAIIVDVPSGSFSLDPPLPPADRRLLGLVAQVAAVPDLHPAVVDRLVEAARRVHGRGDAITAEGTYPTMEGTRLPQDGYARDLIADGPGALAGVLPYWINAQIARVALLVLPVAILLLPLLRLMPGLWRWRLRRRVFRHYARLREIDRSTRGGADADTLRDLDQELAEIDARIADASLPLAYRDYAYQARLHVEHLRRRIRQAQADRVTPS